MKKSNVVNFVKFAQNNGNYYSDHAEHIVRNNEQEPIVYVIQNHINNLRHAYGDDALREVINLLGVMNKNEKKSA